MKLLVKMDCIKHLYGSRLKSQTPNQSTQYCVLFLVPLSLYQSRQPGPNAVVRA